MSSMLQISGWFIVILAILMLIVGFMMLSNHNNRTRSTATPNPRLVWTPTPFFEGTPDEPVLILTARTGIFRPPDPPLRPSGTSPPDSTLFFAEKPICYDTPDGGYSCLGRVWNHSAQPQGSVILSVRAGDQVRHVVTEQRAIPAAGSAPYRVQFEAETAQISDAITPTNPASQRTDMPPYAPAARQSLTVDAPEIERVLALNEALVTLNVTAQRGTVTNQGGYRVTATLQNPHEIPVHDVRLIVTLHEPEWGIVGYRVISLPDALPAQANQVVDIDIIPFIVADTLTHSLTVEAMRQP